MRFLLSLGFVFALMVPALAQQTPPLPGSPPTAKQGAGIIFKEIEKRAIEEFFGKRAAKAAEGDDGGKKGEKKKKKKAKKSKGKGQGKARKSKGKGRGQGLPPGLAKRESLPPGLQKRLEKHGSLPPGLAKRNLPADLESKLPEPPPGLERIIAGDDVVLLEKATGKILDVIEGVLRGNK